MTFTPKPPVEKLPLTVRRDVRDNYDSKKEDFEKKISDILGRPYTIKINVNAVFAYAQDGYAKDQTGKLLADYMESFIAGLENLVQEYPEDGKECFNEVVTASEITLTVDETGQFSYVGGDVKDGVYRILFGESYLGTNINDAGQKIPAAINNAPRSSDFPLFMRASIRNHFEAEIPAVKKAISEESGIAVDELVLDPNFLENYKKLKSDPSSYLQEERIGTVALEYYKGLQYQMEMHKFKGDELMQEGLVESVHKKTFKIRVVDKLEMGSYNEVVVHDGVAYLQMVPGYWYTNTSNMGDNLLRVLDG